MLVFALLVGGALSAATPRAQVPADVAISALTTLTRQGEVIFLPRHGRDPFTGVIVTRAASSCRDVETAMMDVESYARRWAMKEVKILERTPTRVRYDLYLDIAIAPAVPGVVENPSPGRIQFSDPNTGAMSIWTLTDTADARGPGCAMQFSILEVKGKAPSWVGVLRALDEQALDAAYFATQISSARGFTHPERAGSPAPSAEAERAFFTLASHGTALRFLREGGGVPRIVSRRVVTTGLSDTLWAIRDRRRYIEKTGMFSSINDHGLTASYTIAAFGARVDVDTAITETGDPDSPEGLRITERLTGGDVERGGWEWIVRSVPGGTDVQLTWDVDVVSGSRFMRAMADTDPVTRAAMGMVMGLSFMGHVVSGVPLGARPVEKNLASAEPALGVPVAAQQGPVAVPAVQ